MEQATLMVKAQGSQLPSLQSLRGLAACVVLIHHSLFYFATTPHFRVLSEIVFNAHAAVVLFFVLSGFVLVRSLIQSPITWLGIAEFYTKRAFRIYPALWVAVFFAWAYVTAAPHMTGTPQVSGWFDAVYGIPIRKNDFVKAAAGASATVLPPLWTIRTELIASILLPGIAWFAFRGQTWIFSLMLATGALTIAASGLHSGAIMYLVDFVIGACLVRLIRNTNRSTLGSWCSPAAIAAVLVLTFFRSINTDWRFEVNFGAVTPSLVEAISAAVLILVVSVKSQDTTMLNYPSMIHLGDISYSVYLLHFPVLCFLAKGIGSAVPDFVQADPDMAAVLLALLTLLVTLPLSHAVYRLIEMPGINLGRRAANALRNSPGS